MNPPHSPLPRLHFVTGRLAEPALRHVVASAAATLGFDYTIGVMPITVAALMTPRWLKRHLVIPPGTTEVIVPGYCEEGIDELRHSIDVPLRCGPRDLREIPEFLGTGAALPIELDTYDIEILAEINHAPRWQPEALEREALHLRRDGADVIDVGCQPGQRWSGVADAVRRLRDAQLRVSIDSFDAWEVEQACRAGAELVLSVNRSNRDAAADWGVEVVAIPDTPDDLASLDDTVDYLLARNVPLRLDPILEPVGLGLADSLVRYHTIRHRYPEVAMLMGVGNLTELTDVDSAGINVLLMGICQELRIGSVLTTQVINWARSSVRECDLARRLVHYAAQHRVPPKRLSDDLVMLRDPRLRPYPSGVLESLAQSIRDNNYRLFAQDGQLHLISASLHLVDSDPFRLFAMLLEQPQSDNVDASHAFYLGYELAKAVTALTLDKQYEQDEALRWGHLTRAESGHRLPRTSRHRRDRPAS